MSQWLKQSTATTIQLGPFLDEDDGKTAETGLTVEDTDIYLSKNGAAFANPNDTDNAAHDASGWYRKALDGTDTGTLGRLIVMCHESGALPVWREFMVIPSNEFDSLVSGTDALDVEVASMAAGTITAAAIATDAIDADALKADAATQIIDEFETQSQADPTGFHVNVLEVGGTGQTGNDNGADINAILADTGELQTDLANGGRLDALIDAIKAKTDNLPADPADDSDIDAQLATIDTVVDAIKAKTDNLPADPADDSDIDAQLATITTHLTDVKGTGFVKDTDSLVDLAHIGADGDTLETLSDQIDDTATLGAGATTFTYTLTSSVDSSPIADADVWVTSDVGGSNLLANGKTDANGEVVFYLDAGTVYVWRQKSGWNFMNPDTETVA